MHRKSRRIVTESSLRQAFSPRSGLHGSQLMTIEGVAGDASTTRIGIGVRGRTVPSFQGTRGTGDGPSQSGRAVPNDGRTEGQVTCLKTGHHSSCPRAELRDRSPAGRPGIIRPALASEANPPIFPDRNIETRRLKARFSETSLSFRAPSDTPPSPFLRNRPHPPCSTKVL